MFRCRSREPDAKPLLPLSRRGAGAVERGGLENRCPPCGGPRVRIPPSPPALPRRLAAKAPGVPVEPDQDEIVAFLGDARAYGHGVDRVERHDTHISHVFLAGDRAYK